MFEPKIIAYLCTWCSYTGADTAGISRLKSPANVRAIRVPCSGRVSPEIILRTFDQGADGVLVLGCHIGECHYDTGNHRTAKRLPAIRTLMSFAGLEPERLRLDWVSASEGERFARIVNEFTEAIRSLGPVHWRIEAVERINKREPLPGPRVQKQPQLFVPETQAIREKARELLANQEVDCVIGYEMGTHNRTRPAFVYSPEDVDRLVWSQECTHNLTRYLNDKLKAKQKAQPGGVQEKKPRAAVVAKPCDSRTINVMLAENRFERDQVYVIGMECGGILDTGHQQRISGRASGDSGSAYQSKCLRCTEHTPLVADTLIEKTAKTESIPSISKEAWLADWDGMSPAERISFWNAQFDRCIRCYACRQACPVCDCPTCLYERDDSLWVGMGTGPNQNRTFHLGRAYHLAGRCVDCNECEEVCPMEIPISLLNLAMAKELDQVYGFQAGRAAEPPPFLTILTEDLFPRVLEEG